MFVIMRPILENVGYQKCSLRGSLKEAKADAILHWLTELEDVDKEIYVDIAEKYYDALVAGKSIFLCYFWFQCGHPVFLFIY